MKLRKRRYHIFLVIMLSFVLCARIQPKIFSKIFKRTKNPVLKHLGIANEKTQKMILRSDISFNERVLYNIHVVEKNKLYRSAQLAPDVLDRYMKQFKIKTVINLRGAHPDQAWWRDEKAVVERNGAKFLNISMSAALLTSKKKLLNLLEIFDTAPRPILIHCLGGVDRSGEVAALWVLDQQKKSKSKALKQLKRLPYRHKKSQYPAKDFLIAIWQGREWLQHEYNPRNYPQFIADVD